MRTKIYFLAIFLFASFLSFSQSESLTKCACIDSLVVIHDHILANHAERKNEMSEAAQLENSKRFHQLSLNKNQVSSDCQKALQSIQFCENEARLSEMQEEINLIIRVIEMNRRYHQE